MKITTCCITSSSVRLLTSGLVIIVLMILTCSVCRAQEEPVQLRSLKTVPLPGPANLGDFVADRRAALILGKALFWDMQVGSDGMTTCATCHFHAGADSRSINSLSPAQLRVSGPAAAASTFDHRGANVRLTVRDYPFHRLADPANRHSAVLADSSAITGSQGVLKERFGQILPRTAEETRTLVQDGMFSKGGQNTRRVTPRNSPSVINAVFNLRNFWDGRAQDVFNGVNPFGTRDAGARVMRADTPGAMFPVTVRLAQSSLASQAVGPPLSDVEMSADGRSFPDLGKKLLGMRPLARQAVHPEDSVFAGLVHSSGKGLVHSNYLQLVRQAFHPRWWQGTSWVQRWADGSTSLVPAGGSVATNQYSQASWNFALFFGLALQVYESTLVSDDAPFDRYAEGNANALTAAQVAGLGVFVGKARCVACHDGAEFTNASVSRSLHERIERMVFASTPAPPDASGFVNTTGRRVIYDNGFYNIGVRPTREDLGIGVIDPFGYPLSEARLHHQALLGSLGLPMPSFASDPSWAPSADGAFKTPTLRNVELTAPYFHNGGTLTLAQVVDFYNRGSDFKDQNIADVPGDIAELGLTPAEKEQLVAFMRALTDERVRHHRAPFDHPQLLLPNGHPTDSKGAIQTGKDGRSLSNVIELPAAGREGFRALPNFLNVL
jgi:cytochrome c peroxidase